MTDKMKVAEERIRRAKEEGWKVLDLGDLALEELPESLGELVGLRELVLGQTEEFPITNPLFERPIEWCPTSLHILSKLTSLRSLNLAWMPVSDLAPLSSLRLLEELDLSTTGVEDLSPLGKLHSLRVLDAGRTCVTNLLPLSNQTGLQTLSLDECEVYDLTPLTALQELKTLDLGDTLTDDLEPLTHLTKIEVLSLGGTNIWELSPLRELEKLGHIDLSFTYLRSLEPLAYCKNLKSIYLHGIHIEDRTSLEKLQSTESLSLHAFFEGSISTLSHLNKLKELIVTDLHPPLPNSLIRRLTRKPSLSWLTLTEASGIPPELLSINRLDNCLNRLRSYYQEIKLGTEDDRDTKLIILGNGGTGKTQLCRRLRCLPYDNAEPSTHGVQVWRETLSLETNEGKEAFYVNWWDFGGQDIYHGTHALFLQSRAVFLILWTPHLENRDEYEEQGIPLRNQSLPYWLDFVRSRAGKQSPVIVVQSQCDRFAQKREAPVDLDRFDFAQSCFYSAKTGVGEDTLRSQLCNAIAFIREGHGTFQIGSGRAEVRRRLYEWHQEDQERPETEKEHRYLSTEEFQALCDEVGNIVDWRHALDYFHKTGVVFYDPKLFEGRIILDQTWALTAIYTIFDREKAAPLLRDRARGRFTRRELEGLVWREYSEEEQNVFLGMMESCGVCFPIGDTPAGETLYLAPDLLPGETESLPHLHAWDFDAPSPTLRLRYDFFHPALIRALMQEVAEKAGELAHYWKYGLWFKDGSRGGSQLLARFNDISTDADPGAGELELQAQGGDALGLLREIRRFLSRQRMGQEPRETLHLDGKALSGPDLERHLGEDRFGYEKHRVVELRRSREEDVLIEESQAEKQDSEQLAVQPTGLTKEEKPPEVYISYAWGDETPEGKQRTEAVENLCDALREDGFNPLRDQEQIRPGEQISSFMKKLVETDRLVAIVSDKSLRSPYCMFEVYKVFQRSQADPEKFAELVVPLVMPGLSLKSVKDRRPYLRHWRKEADEARETMSDRTITLGSRSWEELRLITQFDHHVDDILVFINDILMPRNLEAHFEDGFEAVRSALRGRMKR